MEKETFLAIIITVILTSLFWYSWIVIFRKACFNRIARSVNCPVEEWERKNVYRCKANKLKSHLAKRYQRGGYMYDEFRRLPDRVIDNVCVDSYTPELETFIEATRLLGKQVAIVDGQGKKIEIIV